MIKVFGIYKLIAGSPVLFIELEDTYLQKLKTHIEQNMFFAYKRLAPQYKKILLISIGDHLDDHDNQNLQKADVAIHVSVEAPIEKTVYELLGSKSFWFVTAVNKSKKHNLVFSIDKDTQFITDRAYFQEEKSE